MTFTNIAKHPLFIEFSKEFEANSDFYDKLEKKGDFIKDEVVNEDYGLEN